MHIVQFARLIIFFFNYEQIFVQILAYSKLYHLDTFL